MTENEKELFLQVGKTLAETIRRDNPKILAAHRYSFHFSCSRVPAGRVRVARRATATGELRAFFLRCVPGLEFVRETRRDDSRRVAII